MAEEKRTEGGGGGRGRERSASEARWIWEAEIKIRGRRRRSDDRKLFDVIMVGDRDRAELHSIVLR